MSMNTNHHIAMQIAAERQRELRAYGGGWSLADLFASRVSKPAHEQERLDVVAPLPEPGPRAGGAGDPHLSEPRIRRNPAGQSAAWAPSHHQRDAHRNERVGT